MGYGAKGIGIINLNSNLVTDVIPSVNTQSTGANLISTILVNSLVVDSKGDVIYSDGFWIYKVTIGQ
jgi:hypothetical protein